MRFEIYIYYSFNCTLTYSIRNISVIDSMALTFYYLRDLNWYSAHNSFLRAMDAIAYVERQLVICMLECIGCYVRYGIICISVM